MRTTTRRTSALTLGIALLAAACAEGEDTIALSTSAASSTSSGSFGSGNACSATTPDQDQDGFTVEQGDCNDCDANANPGAVEVPDSGADENCDGKVDEDAAIATCDDGLAIDSLLAEEGARALDLCQSTASSPVGVVSAKYTQMDGSEPPSEVASFQRFHVGHGLATKFGNLLKPRRGSRFLVLSTGEARDLDDPQSTKGHGYGNPHLHKFYDSSPPDGFPKPVAYCQDGDPPLTTGLTMVDSIGLELEIKTPSNATGFSFDHYYMTGSFPYSCFDFSPFFALLDPMPKGQFDGNIVFDKTGEYIGLLPTIRVCGCAGGPPCRTFDVAKPPMNVDCPLGDADLLGTGFGRDGGDPGGGTGWQRTQAPVEPSSTIKLRFAISQADLGLYDATVLIDNWQWLLQPGVAVGTAPN